MSVRAADAATLQQVVQRVALSPLLGRYRLAPDAFFARLSRAHAEGDGLLVAMADDLKEPVGLAWYLARGAFGTGSYLRLLLVAPSHLGQGLGAALLHEVEARCQQAPGGHFVLSETSNAPALAFYLGHGYAQVGVLPDFVRPGHTEALLWKPHLTAQPG